jgi:hypothetical protein
MREEIVEAMRVLSEARRRLAPRPRGYITDLLVIERAIALVEAGGDVTSGCAKGPWCLTCNLYVAWRLLCAERDADGRDDSPLVRALAVVRLRWPARRGGELCPQALALTTLRAALEDVR